MREIEKTKSRKRIGILGAGITGLTLARFFAQAGHEVTIFDQHLGGKLRAMKKPKDREDFALPLQEAENMLERLHIHWEKRKIFSPEELEAWHFDRLFAAVGSMQEKIQSRQLRVVEASEAILSMPEEQHIAVIGGGYIGLETARYLAMMGKRVTVIEKTETVGLGIGETVIGRMMKEVKELGIQLYPGYEILSEEDVLKICPQAQVIVQSCHYVKNQAMMEAFEDSIFAGSAKGAMRILECTEDAWQIYEKFSSI